MSSRLVFQGPGRVALQPFDAGEPGPGQVRLKSLVSAISAGTESLLWHGTWPEGMALDGVWAPEKGSAAYPVAFGYACVGRIEALGAEVDSSYQGRLAFTFTAHQTHVTADLADLWLLPPGLQEEDGVFLASMETALSLAQDAAPVVGERSAVWGLGSIGILTASLLNGSQGWDRLKGRRDRASAFGVNVGRPEPGSCDVVVELTGNPRALDEALAAARFAGRVIVGSWYGAGPVEVALGGEFHRSRIELVSSQVSTLAPVLSGRWTKRRRLEAALSLLAKLLPSRLVTHRFPLDQAQKAYELACDRPDEALQVLFSYE